MTRSNTPVSLLGVPLDLGGESLGVDIGPKALRHQKIVEKLQHVGLKAADIGDIGCRSRSEIKPGDPRMHYVDEIVRVNQEVAKQTNTVVKKGGRLVVLGGDHSITLGAVSGVSAVVKGDLGLIYLDAHGDMNTDKTTLSGNVHGMCLASLMGFGADVLKNVYKPGTKLAKENMLHIGGSDFDQAELDLIKNEKLQAFTLFDLLTQNLAPLLGMIDRLASRVKHVWVSLDLDVIDRTYAPGAGMPNPKGLSYREIATIAEYVGKKCSVIGVDVVEYNPLQDVNNQTAELSIELVAKFLGKDYSWYTRYMETNKVE